jgi:hypothetical protein
MISYIPARSLLWVSAGLLLFAGSALCEESVFDPQGQARGFILAKPRLEAAVVSVTKLSMTGSAADNRRVDPQEHAREFLRARAPLDCAVDSRPYIVAATPAPGYQRFDPQEQAQQFILAKVDSGSGQQSVQSVAKDKASSKISERRHGGG